MGFIKPIRLPIEPNDFSLRSFLHDTFLKSWLDND